MKRHSNANVHQKETQHCYDTDYRPVGLLVRENQYSVPDPCAVCASIKFGVKGKDEEIADL